MMYGGPTANLVLLRLKRCYALVICIPGSLGAGDSGDIVGPKCRD